MGLMTACAPIAGGEPEYGVPLIDNDGDGFHEEIDCDDNDSNVLGGVNYHEDADGDGFGATYTYEMICEGDTPQEGWIENGEDCDDNNPDVHPGAEETADDGIDSNCNNSDND